MDKNELEKEKTALMEAERKHSDQEKFLAALPGRISSAEEKVSMLRSDLERSREERPRIIERIALGKAKEEDLTHLTATTVALEAEVKDAEGILEQLTKAQRDGLDKLNKLSLALQGARHSFWSYICQYELEKTRKESTKLITPFIRAWCASCLSGISQNLGGFLATKVQFNQVDIPETGEIQKALVKEYLGGGSK